MKKGFTLIELLVVVLIIGILSSIALPNYKRSVERARVAEVQTLLRAIHESQERLLWQKQIPSYTAALSSGQGFGFDKLDITIKGTYMPSSRTGVSTGILKTENFTYEMYPEPYEGGNLIVAHPIKGSYQNTAEIGFNGREFMCKPEGHKVCKIWGADTWNQL